MNKWIVACLLILPAACQKVPSEHDAIAPVCSSAQAVTGEEISYGELIDSRNFGFYVLRNVSFGVDGRASLAQDLKIHGRAVAPGAQRCRAKDGGGISSFRLSEVDPNLTIPVSINARDGSYTSYLDLYFRRTTQGVVPEGRMARCHPQTLAQAINRLRSGGAAVRIYRDIDTIILVVERTTSDPYIYRANLTFRQI